jgi:SAM-dependent methyltransferase
MPHALMAANTSSNSANDASIAVLCPACASSAVEPRWPGARWPGNDAAGFQVLSCAACRVAFTSPRLSAEQIAPYYAENYYGACNQRFHPWLEAIVRRFRQRRAAKIASFVKPGRALDIGCGRGWTLADLRERGWNVQGVEFSPEAARFAREELKLAVSTSGFDGSNYRAAEFDAVVLWHVLEHLPDAMPALAEVARIMRPGGVLALSVPNLASWQARLSRYAWFHLDLPRHYWHFSAGPLVENLERLGFRVVEVHHACAEQNPYGWIQSLLNRCGLRHNLLYDLIRRRGARGLDQPWLAYPIQSLISITALVLMSPLAFLMLLPEAIFKAGATVELYALREDASPAATSSQGS